MKLEVCEKMEREGRKELERQKQVRMNEDDNKE
jgi:hypothetical protein